MPEAIDAEVARLKLAALGHRARADDRGAGRVRGLLAARHLTVAPVATEPPQAPARTSACGSRPDPRRRPRRRRRRPAGRAVGRRRRRLLDRGPARRGAAARSSSGRRADGTTVDLTPAPFNVRTRVHEYGGGVLRRRRRDVVFSNFADGRLYRLDPGDATPVADHPGGPWRYADLRFDPARRRFYAVREDHAADVEPINTIVAIPLDGERRRRSSSTGPDFVASPRLSPDGSPPRLARMGPPRHALGRDAAPHGRRSSRMASLGRVDLAAGGPDESIVQPEWSPDGVAPPHQRPDRLVEPVPAASRARGWSPSPRWRPSSPTPPGSSTARATASCPTARSWRSPGRRVATDLFHVEPGRLLGEVDSAFTELDGAARRCRQGRRRSPARRPSRPTLVALRPDDPGPVRGPATVDVARDRPGCHLDRRSRSTSPRPTGASRTRSSTRRRTPPSRARGRVAAARRAIARRPDRECLERARPGEQFLTSRGHRGRGRRLRRQHRLRPRLPAGARRGVGRRRRRRLHRGGPVPGRRAATSTRSGWPSRAAAPAATRRSPRSPSATSSRPASACSASATSSCSRATPTSSSRATTTGWSGRIPRRRPLPRALAGPLPRPDLLPGPGPPGPRRQGRPAGAGGGDRRRPSRPTASRTPTSRSRARATGSAARRRSGGARGGALVPRRGLRLRARRTRSSR